MSEDIDSDEIPKGEPNAKTDPVRIFKLDFNFTMKDIQFLAQLHDEGATHDFNFTTKGIVLTIVSLETVSLETNFVSLETVSLESQVQLHNEGTVGCQQQFPNFGTDFNSTTEDIVLPEITQVQLHNEGTTGCQRTTSQFQNQFQLHDGGYRATRDNTSSTSQRRDGWLSTNNFSVSSAISTPRRRISCHSRQHKFNFTTKGQLVVNKHFSNFRANFNFTAKDIGLETTQVQLHNEGTADCQQDFVQSQFQLHTEDIGLGTIFGFQLHGEGYPILRLNFTTKGPCQVSPSRRSILIQKMIQRPLAKSFEFDSNFTTKDIVLRSFQMNSTSLRRSHPWKPGSGGRLLGSGDYDGVVTEYDLERNCCRSLNMTSTARDGFGAWNIHIGTHSSGHLARMMAPYKCGTNDVAAVNVWLRCNHQWHVAPFVASRHTKTVTYVRFLDSQTMVSAGTDGCLKLWNISDSHLIRTYKGHKNCRSFVGLSVWRRGGLLGCGSENNKVFVYDKRWGEPIRVRGFEPMAGVGFDHGFVNSVCWRQVQEDKCTLLAGGSNGVLQVFVGTKKS
ncbi:F-box/LRR-repeat protein [Hibiscus syriacus]|uniref:F-box/LRR-repeat protein n=1 Tax=Hibiscus syriacus TaxID=106335 RepID=A0A6A3ANA7_HIBSY|nr:F-box/LRR-repeat protein [Hibiscus syriacus]